MCDLQNCVRVRVDPPRNIHIEMQNISKQINERMNKV